MDRGKVRGFIDIDQEKAIRWLTIISLIVVVGLMLYMIVPMMADIAIQAGANKTQVEQFVRTTTNSLSLMQVMPMVLVALGIVFLVITTFTSLGGRAR
ncbi:MAG: hypothetical protein ACK4SY_07050 [Pyrobaculum sp.]